MHKISWEYTFLTMHFLLQNDERVTNEIGLWTTQLITVVESIKWDLTKYQSSLNKITKPWIPSSTKHHVMNDIKLADAVQYIVVIMLDIACLTLGCLAWWQWCVYEING